MFDCALAAFACMPHCCVTPQTSPAAGGYAGLLGLAPLRIAATAAALLACRLHQTELPCCARLPQLFANPTIHPRSPSTRQRRQSASPACSRCGAAGSGCCQLHSVLSLAGFDTLLDTQLEINLPLTPRHARPSRSLDAPPASRRPSLAFTSHGWMVPPVLTAQPPPSPMPGHTPSPLPSPLVVQIRDGIVREMCLFNPDIVHAAAR